MKYAACIQFIRAHLNDCDFGVWLKDDYDNDWRKWYSKGAIKLCWQDWLQHPQQSLTTTPISSHDSTPYYVISFRIDFLSKCEVRIVICSTTLLTAVQQEHLEYIIRESLLRTQIRIERVHHQRWLKSLRELTGSLDLNELLFKIIENALNVLPSVSTGLFLMMDPLSGKMVPRAQIGFKDTIYNYYADLDEGITGKVYRDGKGRIYQTPESVIEDMQNVDTSKLDIVLSSFPAQGGITRGMLAVPVTMNSDKIGVMLVYQLEEGKLLNADDLDKLQGFADQAAIAISNARMYSELVDTNNYLIQRNDIHNRFTQLSIENISLADMIATIAKMLNVPTFFVDFATNEWYPTLPVDDLFKHINLDQLLTQSVQPLTLAGHNEHSFYIYPTHKDDLLVGCFVIELERALQPLDHIVLEQGSAVVMLQMMNTYSMTEMVYRRSRDFFEDLLHQRQPNQLASTLQRFGLSPQAPLFVCLLQFAKEYKDSQVYETHMRKLIAMIEKKLGTANYLLFGSHDKITILMSARDQQTKEKWTTQIRAVVQSWSLISGLAVYGGVGGLYEGLHNVVKSNEEATRSISFLQRRQRIDMIAYDEIGINRLFLHQQPQEIKNYTEEVLSPLRQYAVTGTELEQTLRCYIACNRSVATTAEKLHIHTNTLYLRLRKVEELLQVDLNDSEDWMKVYLACHLSET